MPDGAAADSVLLAFLDAQRDRAFEVVAGLDETQLRTAALPSGWTPVELIEHLGHAERHWFQEVLLGAADPLPWTDEPDGASRSTEAVFAFSPRPDRSSPGARRLDATVHASPRAPRSR